jgi:hypothetical protein
MYSSAFTLIGYGVRSHASNSNTFLSTADNAAWSRGALQVGSDLIFSNAGAQTTAVGSNVTMTERFRVAANGNVGIGTASPDSKLEVAGMISLSNAGTSAAYDRVKLSYNGYNSGTPEVIFEPGTTPGSGTVNTYFRFINSNGSSTTSNNKANLTIGGNLGISEDSPNAAISIGTANTYVQEWEYAKGFKRNDTGASGANGNYNESTYINVQNYRGTCIDYYESGHYFNNGAAYYFRHSRIYVIMESSTLRVADVVLVRSTGNRTDAIVNAPSIAASANKQFTITSTVLSGFTHYVSVDAVGSGFRSIGSIG